ncbi:MAG: polysaccharide deacetylase [Lachnospiraceae bacterium]|nr:polysaccharide deacetylase [Lachnospiraceae bacterium]
MNEGSNQSASKRKKRVNRLKKTIISLAFALIFLPIFTSIYLIFKVSDLNKTIGQMQEKVDELYAVYPVIERAKAVSEAPIINSENEVYDDSSAGFKTVEYSYDQAAEKTHKVYLTFDDGPSPFTDEILDILDEYDVEATFFVVGSNCEKYPDMVKDIVDRGHSLGMHSYSHKYNEIYSDMESFVADFEKVDKAIYDICGFHSGLYRFPGGSSNTVNSVNMKDLATYLRGRDVEYYDWNISSGDGGSGVLSVERLVKNSVSDIEEYGSSIILLHDSYEKPSTVEALPQMIEKILAMDDTEILPITAETVAVHHIK